MSTDKIELSDPVHRLTEPWVLVLNPAEVGTYKPQDFPPLLDMLRHLITPDQGRTMGGVNDPSARSVIDLKAFDLLASIEDVTRAWLAQWGVPASRDLKVDMVAFYSRLETLWRTRMITENDYVRLSEYPGRWATQVWDLIEPPLQVALRATPCPYCERAKWVNESGEWVDNILVSYRLGGVVQADCRWRSCGASWSGPRELRDLGFSIGAQQDDEALQEMGYGA